MTRLENNDKSFSETPRASQSIYIFNVSEKEMRTLFPTDEIPTKKTFITLTTDLKCKSYHVCSLLMTEFSRKFLEPRKTPNNVLLIEIADCLV